MFCALTVLALSAVPAFAAGGPTWSQFQGGPGHPGTIAGAPAPPYRVAWRFHPSDNRASGAVIFRDVAITVGLKAVYGVDLVTGQIRWQLVRNGGPIAMPAVGVSGGKTVLVFSDEASSGDASLVGVDLDSMREIWRVPLEAPSRTGVAMDGGLAVACDDDGNVYGVKIESGEVAWTSKPGGTIDAAAAVSGGTVFVVSRDPSGRQVVRLLALDEGDGKQMWEFTPRVAGATASAPAASDGTAVFGSADRVVRSVGRDGLEGWGSLTNSLFSPVSGPALTGAGDVFMADAAGGLYRIDASTGKRVWDYQLNDLNVRSSPVVAGNTALVGLNDGRMVAVDVESGDLVWQNPASPGLIGPIALSPTAIVAVKGGSRGGLIAFVHEDGELVDVPSPTKVNAGKLFGNYALALVVATVLLFVPLRLLAVRFAGPVIKRSGETDVDEEVDEDDGEDDR